MSKNLETLLEQAAQLRCCGASWEAVGHKVNRRASTCRGWPRRYRKQWDPLYQYARSTRAVELVCEAESTLRVLLRDKDPKNQIKSAEVLLKHRYIPPENTEPNAMPDDGQERRTQAEWAEIEQTRSMDSWRQSRGLPPYTSLQDRMSELKQFYEARTRARVQYYREMIEMDQEQEPARTQVTIATSASEVQESPPPVHSTRTADTGINGRLLVSLAVVALALGTLGGAMALGQGPRAPVVPVAKDSKIDACNLNANNTAINDNGQIAAPSARSLMPQTLATQLTSLRWQTSFHRISSSSVPHPKSLLHLQDYPMKKALSLFALVCLTALPASAADVEAPKGFTPLFNGKDLDGWHGWAIHEKGFGPYDLAKLTPDEQAKKIETWTADSKKHWSTQNNELVNDGAGAYLATDKDYGDFEFLIDYKTVAKADSGIYLRASPQVQIWDYTEAGGKWKLGADKGSGGLWNNSAGAPGKDPLVLADKPFGEWNSFRIVMVGERVSIWLNGKHIVDHARLENLWDRKKPLLKKAPIVLQTHGGEIRWRNIFIREIASDEANDILRKHGSTGFKEVFNGKDFEGWAGPTANYDVNEGTVVCKPGKGGTIFTKEEFDDFVARVDIKIPKGGNNGLAIRYPGKGDPAYAGMCELQVLDDDYETARKAKIDPRQAHGSAYGMAAAARGYQRPIGEWNFQEVTVKGSTIKVELNGTVILDTDLSKITEYMAKSAHPGKELPKGAFGFAGHSDPVAFKNVLIKKLEK